MRSTGTSGALESARSARNVRHASPHDCQVCVTDHFASGTRLRKRHFAAASRFLGSTYVEHDPSVADGHAGLSAYITLLKESQPQSVHEVRRALVEHDHVVLQVHSVPTPGTTGDAIAHVYRLENEKAVEHWDILQTVPVERRRESPNPTLSATLSQ